MEIKSTTAATDTFGTAKRAYEKPSIEVIEISNIQLLISSPAGASMRVLYEEEDWDN